MRTPLVILLLVAACSPDDGAGQLLHGCRNGDSPCDPGLMCYGGVCIVCGTYGEVCCWPDGIGTDYCNNGLVCAGADDSLGQCTGDCGYFGEACCLDATCPGGGECGSDGTCGTPPNDPCFSGSTEHLLIVLDAHCVRHEVTLWTDTLEEAEACRQEIVGMANVKSEVCPLDTAPEPTNLCKNGFGPMVLETCSTQQLEVCQNEWCFDCDWAPTTDTCPLGPMPAD